MISSWPHADAGGRVAGRVAERRRKVGEVAERSNATDCKSVALAASEVRILPSPPASARRSGTRSGRRRASAGRPATPTVELGWADGGGTPQDERLGRTVVGRRGPACRSEGHTGREGGSNSVVESQPSKLLVAGSIPVSRSIFGGRVSQPSLAKRAWRLTCC